LLEATLASTRTPSQTPAAIAGFAIIAPQSQPFFTGFNAIVKRTTAFSCSDIEQLLSLSVWRKFGQ
jgi:hypothetical protein